MDEKLYTWKELSQLVGVGESTARNFRDRFQGYFPTFQDGQTILYKSQCLDVLKYITEERQRKTSFEDIELKLAGKFTKFIEVSRSIDQESDQTNQQSKQENNALISADNLKEQLSSIPALTEAMTRLAIAQEKRNQLLEEQNGFLREQVFAMGLKIKEIEQKQALENKPTEKQEDKPQEQQDESKKKKSWFRRLFS